MTNMQYCIARAFHQLELAREPGWDATARALFPDPHAGAPVSAPVAPDKPFVVPLPVAAAMPVRLQAPRPMPPRMSRERILERGQALREANRKREHNIVLAALRRG